MCKMYPMQIITNEIAENIVAELMSSLSHDAVDALVSVVLKDGNKDAQIAAEAFKRVLPTITTHEHIQVATDVLRWYQEGEDLDHEDRDDVTSRFEIIVRLEHKAGYPHISGRRLLQAIYPDLERPHDA